MSLRTMYHPQTNGLIEVVNKTIENYLMCFSGDRPKDWSAWIPLEEWWYNPTPYLSNKLTPFEALYGYPLLDGSNIYLAQMVLKLLETPFEPETRYRTCLDITYKKPRNE